ncbi:hypothetical protein HK096_002660, partial [Nowakowskiella sp. JEL0078]
FYSAYQEGMQSDTFTLTSIIMNSSTLFEFELDGIRALVPYIILGIRRILPRLEPHFACHIPPSDLRKAAMKLIATLIAIPNRFERILIPGWCEIEKCKNLSSFSLGDESLLSKLVRALYTDSNPQNLIDAPFISLKNYLANILLSTLVVETTPSNTRYLLNIITCFLIEDVGFSPGMPSLVIKALQEKNSKLLVVGQWPQEVMMSVLQTLSNLTLVWEHIKRDNKSLNQNCPRELVLVLCRYIDNLILDDGNLVATQTLIIRSYDCLIKWILLGIWITEDKDCLTSAINTFSRGISLMDREEVFSFVPTNPIPSTTPQLFSPPIFPISLNSATTPTSLDKKKSIRNPTQSKLFNRLRAQPNTPVTGVSTGTKDNGAGLPTFAHLSAAIAIKSAAETAVAQLANHLNNFPPLGERTGVSTLGTMWREDIEARRLVDVRRLNENGIARHGSVGMFEVDSVNEFKQLNGENGEWRKYLRYFALENRVLIGLLEDPDWARKVDCVRKGSRLSVSLRDCSGHYAWTSVMQYQTNGREAGEDLGERIAKNVIQFSPPKSPYLPDTAVFSVVCVNESSIVKMVDLCSIENEMCPFSKVNAYTQSQVELENKFSQKIKDTLAEPQKLACPPTTPDRLNEDFIPDSFKRFLVQMGFLSLENRGKLVPLNLNEILLRDIEKLDSTLERDCMTISVLFCRSGLSTASEIINPLTISEDFEQFVHCLAWPVNLTHPGFKGNLGRVLYETAPYFANRSIEVIFHCPYFISLKKHRTRPTSLELDVQSISVEAKISIDEFSTSAPQSFELELSVWNEISKEDLVYIIWIEDYHQIHQVPKTLGVKSGMLYIYIHPLPQTP